MNGRCLQCGYGHHCNHCGNPAPDCMGPVHPYDAAIAAIEKHIVRRLITCADNGYDTAELHDIVEDARKAVGR